MSANASERHYSAVESNSGVAAIDDEIDYYVYLAKGIYTLKTLHVTNSNRGIFTFLLNTWNLTILSQKKKNAFTT
jgi:hypothetical protein